MDDEARGWYARGYLPHFDPGEVTQFITWRTHDSLPSGLLEQWADDFAHLPSSRAKVELGRKVSRHLDGGFGSCVLRRHLAAKIVQDSILFGHQTKYELWSWVVMPNHVHVLLTPRAG